MNIKNFKKFAGVIASAFVILGTGNANAQENLSYQKPPKEIEDIINRSVNRNVIISNSGNYLVLLQEPSYPDIKEIGKPHLKLAGTRIYAESYRNTRTTLYSSIAVKNVNSAQEIILKGIPENVKISHVSFSPNESAIAFCVNTDDTTELWTANLNSSEAVRLTHFQINDTYEKPYQWSPDGVTILAKFTADKLKQPSIDETTGPVVMENLGKKSPSRTYQDLLRNTSDEKLFDYYFTSQLKMVYLNGQTVNYSLPAIIKNFDFSPDGKMVMIWSIQKPYSYNVTINRFPFSVDIYDKYGALVKNLAKTPLADNLSSGFDAVITGPREFQWRADKPQTYIWVEAQDSGNPSSRVSVRDIIYIQDVSENKKSKLADCYLRFNSIHWGDENIAIITERWWKTRTERRVFIKPNNPSYRVNLWDRYYEDAYSNPGRFVTTKNVYNKDVLLLESNPLKRLTDPNNVNIFSISDGASPSGDRPFLLKFNVKTKVTDTLFRSKAPFYEKPEYYNLSGKLIFSRESAVEQPNYYLLDLRNTIDLKNIDVKDLKSVLDLRNRRERQLTFFPHPYPNLFGITKKQVNYKRADGLNLTANVYLPSNYSPSQGKLPVLMWAYPREFKTSFSAGQVKGSPYRFPEIPWRSPIFWVTQGFAVMDNMDMPIVGESNEQPNDTFIEQLKENAAAAINKIVEMGIGDRSKIAIGGHSYGAFMTANLLAHTNLFAAGIARSGAYNRTLTPFGFQSEERTYWEANDVYYKISPFSYADKIKTPILLIHGEADENSGTFPLQSERFYNALRGNGGTARLVLLPHEAHGYKAKQSVLHMLWEMDMWLKTYVKK